MYNFEERREIYTMKPFEEIYFTEVGFDKFEVVRTKFRVTGC